MDSLKEILKMGKCFLSKNQGNFKNSLDMKNNLAMIDACQTLSNCKKSIDFLNFIHFMQSTGNRKVVAII